MKYIEMKIHARSEAVEEVSARLMGEGITGISIDDPADIGEILEDREKYRYDYISDSLKEGLDREAVITVYLSCDDEGRKASERIRRDMETLRATEGIVEPGTLRTEEEVHDDSEWKDNWKQYFKPARITEDITVKPAWEEYEPSEGEHVIIMEPGMAFGTGTHETTSLCLKLMEKHLEEAGDKEILDIGCGTGILAIAAALKGCRSILGVDIDEDAVEVARENAEMNGVADAVRIERGDLTEGIDCRADIIVANLMAHLVMMLTPSVPAHMKEGGVFISSGILIEKKKDVMEVLQKEGFTVTEVMEDGEWCAISAVLG